MRKIAMGMAAMALCAGLGGCASTKKAAEAEEAAKVVQEVELISPAPSEPALAEEIVSKPAVAFPAAKPAPKPAPAKANAPPAKPKKPEGGVVAATAVPASGTLSQAEREAIDLLASGAAARAVLAMRCESAAFDAVSKSVQKRLERRVVDAASPGKEKAALAMGRSAAKSKYKAMLAANGGLACQDLGRLRQLAGGQDFLP